MVFMDGHHDRPKESTVKTRQRLQLVTPRTTKSTIEEGEAFMARRRMKYFVLWACNNWLVVVCFIGAMGIVTANMFGILINGGNGVALVGFLAALAATLVGLIQLFRLERGYELEDWLPRAAFGNRAGL